MKIEWRDYRKNPLTPAEIAAMAKRGRRQSARAMKAIVDAGHRVLDAQKNPKRPTTLY